MTRGIDVDAVVIGAGPSGLAAALALLDLGLDVEIFESEQAAGGNLRAIRADGAILSLGPQAFPRQAANAWWLVDRAGLRDRVTTPPHSTRFVFRGGRLHALPTSPAAFITSRLLSTRGKLRMVTEPLRSRGGHDGESVRSFFSRRLGDEAVSALVEPFVTGIHAGDTDLLDARAAFPTLVEWERRSGSLLKGALSSRSSRRGATPPAGMPRAALYSIRGGLGELAFACAHALGTRLHVGEEASSVSRDGGAWRVTTTSGERSCRHVVMAIPAPRAARLLEGVSREAGSLAAGVTMAPIAVVHLGGPLKSGERPPEGFGVLVASGEGLATLGTIFTSSIFPDVAPPRSWLQATYLGGARDPGVIERDDATLRAVVASETRRILGFDADRGLVRIVRHPAGIPQLVRGHRERITALRAEISRTRGLALAGNWLDGIGLDAAIASGRVAAAGVAAAGVAA